MANLARVHSVQFYDDHQALIDRLCGVVCSGLLIGNSIMIVSTAAHRTQLIGAQSTETTKFSGTVTDASGAVIVGANVRFHRNQTFGNHPPQRAIPDVLVQTDPNGEFSVDVSPGLYDICAHAGGFLPTCETATISMQQLSPYQTSLKVDTTPICILRVDLGVPLEQVELPASIPSLAPFGFTKLPTAIPKP
ncbi:MAG: carboxypeptidase-like regulatory domain-containing protein [Candidatus Korobacteraceae bacterium]